MEDQKLDETGDRSAHVAATACFTFENLLISSSCCCGLQSQEPDGDLFCFCSKLLKSHSVPGGNHWSSRD